MKKLLYAAMFALLSSAGAANAQSVPDNVWLLAYTTGEDGAGKEHVAATGVPLLENGTTR